MAQISENTAVKKATGYVSKDWAIFAENLMRTLPELSEDNFLILCTKGINSVVQFAAQGAWGMRAETTSNPYRTPATQLSDAQMTDLLKAGWNPPTRDPLESTPGSDPDGSPNFFLELTNPVDFDWFVKLTVRTFVEVLGVTHPGQLEYEAFDTSGKSLTFPQVGLKRRVLDANEAGGTGATPEELLATLRELTGIPSMEIEEDGDVGLCYESVTVFAKLLEDRPYLRLYSVLLSGVDESLELLQVLNELNADNGHIHLMYLGREVIAFGDTLLLPFDASTIGHALSNFCQIADEFNLKLQIQFGDASFIEKQTTAIH